MYTDESGEVFVWVWLFLDHCFGFIHFAVQFHIIKNNPGIGMEKAVYNSSNEKCGRADVFDLTTGEVWEIKTEKTGKKEASDQVSIYCQTGNRLNDCNEALKKGEAGRFQDSFYLSCLGERYTVTYETPAPGVILYRVEKTNTQGNDDYAVYVPKFRRSKDSQSTIGGKTVYGGRTSSGGGSIAACGVAGLFLLGFACFGGGGCGRLAFANS